MYSDFIIIIISFFKVDFYITFYNYKKPINVHEMIFMPYTYQWWYIKKKISDYFFILPLSLLKTIRHNFINNCIQQWRAATWSSRGNGGIKPLPLGTGRKLKVHKTFRTHPGRFLNVLYALNLRPVPRGLVYQQWQLRHVTLFNRLNTTPSIQTADFHSFHIM